MEKKALIITWDGYQDQELIYPYYRLQEEGFTVQIASTTDTQTIGLFGIKFASQYRAENLFNEQIPYFELLILPGGVKALEKVRQSPAVLEFIHEWDKQNKIIASVCHGAQLLISAGVTKGKTISGYYSIKDDITNAGATYSSEPVISKNIISAAHYKDMPEWMKLTLKELKNRGI